MAIFWVLHPHICTKWMLLQIVKRMLFTYVELQIRKPNQNRSLGNFIGLSVLVYY